MPTVRVDLGDRSYDVRVENGLLARAGSVLTETGLRGKVAVVSDTNVAAFHADTLLQALKSAGYSSSLHIVPAGEASKSMKQAEALCSELAESGHDRRSFLVALGGGVVGDLAGFVAAIFFRGIPFVQIPTTIVAQVDSSVGGKPESTSPKGKTYWEPFINPPWSWSTPMSSPRFQAANIAKDSPR